jgi:hypothetical protein
MSALEVTLCWVPAADLLPLGPHDVLVTDSEEIWIGFYNNGEWFRHESDDPVGVVVQHWMELPEAPAV